MAHSRRNILKLYGLGSLSLAWPAITFAKLPTSMRKRSIPSSGEQLSVVGLGTWQTFDAGNSPAELRPLSEVLSEMQRLGGQVIDSSPMYGRSESVVGRLSREGGQADSFFYATKVWTRGREAGINQMRQSFEKMGRKSMDLMQIHNLVDWKTHVRTLKQWKDEGLIRYWGITHYTDQSHGQLEAIIKSEKPDFAQFNYSIRSRHAEKSLLPCCLENGTAVLINQPYESGALFRAVKGKALPGWAADFDIDSWGQYFLKFILSHPAVTCVIPGTSNPRHLVDNMGAGYGKLPDKALRDKMPAIIG